MIDSDRLCIDFLRINEFNLTYFFVLFDQPTNHPRTQFGYDTGKGPSGQSFREETRLPDGTVKGQYGYLDAQNKMRIVKYTAGLNGFQIDSDSALSDQQLAASRPSHPVQPAPQPAPAQHHQQQQAPPQSPYYQQAPALLKPPGYQGLAQAASSQPASIAHYAHPNAYQSPSAYGPPPPPQASAAAPTATVQQPYTGYPAAPQAYPPSYTANPTSPYAPNQLTPAQLQQQTLYAARARQAALARQQQQEAVIRQQQQAATEAILSQQRAAAQAHAQAQQQQQQQQQASQYQSQYNQPQYNQPQYNQPQYNQPQYNQPQYNQPQSYAPQQQQQLQQPSYASQQPYTSPVTASAAAAATSSVAQPQANQAAPSSAYGPRHASSELKPDLLSNFIQLPGVKLIQLDRKPIARSSSYSPNVAGGSFGLNSAASGSGNTNKPEDDYQGPVVINAALLSYNIGANQQAVPAQQQKKA